MASTPEGPLAGKAVVVTGAGRGIGRCVAREAARLGASVIVNDLAEVAAEADAVVREIGEMGGVAYSLACDISEWSAARGLIDRCIEQFGRIDGLVNMAGLFRMGSLRELEPQTLELLWRVNVQGSAACAHHAAEAMIAQRAGSIVNVVSGAHMGIPRMGIYAATKGAVASFTYAWALELDGSGVRVNAISPLGKTRMVDETGAYQDRHQLPRYPSEPPDPAMNAGAVCYLLSDLSADLTGQILRVEGRHLSLVAHPAIATPVLERDWWTFEAVAEAFRDELAARQAPVGVCAVDVRPVPGGSAMWRAHPASGA